MGYHYKSEEEARRFLVEIGRKLYDKNLVVTNDGNISVKIKENEILVTPTSVSKGFMTEDMMVRMDLSGNILSGKYKPSSEVKMHLRVYNENKKINAVVHAHPPIATAFSIAGIPLNKAIMVESAVQLGVVPIVGYALAGTSQVGDGVVPYCMDYGGVLLSNHGAITWGRDLTQAHSRMEILENYAKTTLYLQFLGKERQFSKSQIEDIKNMKKDWNFTDGILPEGVEKATNLEDIIKGK